VEMMKRHHPDRVEGLGEEFTRLTRTTTQRIVAAYEMAKRLQRRTREP
jgi:DnaJ-domain-containing protein 1